MLLAAFTGYIAYSYFNWSAFNYAILLVFFLSYLVYSFALPLGNRRSKIISCILAAVYTFLNSAIRVPLLFSGGIAISTLLSFSAIIFLLILSAIRFILFKLEKYNIVRRESESDSRSFRSRQTLFLFLGTVVFIFLSHLPFYLGDFPGVLVADSKDELKMIQGILPMDDNHPLAHTMMIKVLFSFGEFIAPAHADAGIICYSIVQMLLVSSVFSYALVTMYKCHMRWWYILISLCFFAFMPYNSTLSYLVWKDTPFSACVLAFSVTVWNIVYKRRLVQLPDWFDTVIYFISAFGVCMFRHNGIAAFIPVAIIFFFMYFKSSIKLNAASLLVISLFAFYILSNSF